MLGCQVVGLGDPGGAVVSVGAGRDAFLPAEVGPSPARSAYLHSGSYYR